MSDEIADEEFGRRHLGGAAGRRHLGGDVRRKASGDNRLSSLGIGSSESTRDKFGSS